MTLMPQQNRNSDLSPGPLFPLYTNTKYEGSTESQMRKRNTFLSWIGEGLSQGSSLGESGAT